MGGNIFFFKSQFEFSFLFFMRKLITCVFTATLVHFLPHSSYYEGHICCIYFYVLLKSEKYDLRYNPVSFVKKKSKLLLEP